MRKEEPCKINVSCGVSKLKKIEYLVKSQGKRLESIDSGRITIFIGIRRREKKDV